MSTDREASSIELLTAPAGRQDDHVNLINHVSGLIPALNKLACHAERYAAEMKSQLA